MKKYKMSQYNLIIQEDEKNSKTYIFNTYSCKGMWIPSILVRREFSVAEIDEEFAKRVLKLGFIVPFDTDEAQIIKDIVNEKATRNDILYLTIAVTMACNYRCVYCFESERLCQTEYMTEETADAIIEFVLRYYKENNITKPLGIKWFGGEPLLNMPIIRYITKRLRDNNIEIQADMFTNGYFLTKDIALELKELGVTGSVVIPLDGLSENYAKLKSTTKESFDRVIKNIQAAQDILNIRINLNITEDNKDDMTELYRLLREEWKITSNIITVKIKSYTDTADDYITSEHYAETANKVVYRKYDSLGMICEARYKGFYSISTDGDMYLCEHMLNHKEHAVGNVRNCTGASRIGTVYDINTLSQQCSNCSILPFCLEGCPTMLRIQNIKCRQEAEIEIVKSNIRCGITLPSENKNM